MPLSPSLASHVRVPLLALVLIAWAGAAPAQPTPSQGLQLWLQSDAVPEVENGAPVSTWPDQSGNGHDLLASGEKNVPTYVGGAINGKPVLRFEGGDGFGAPSLSRVLASAGAYTLLEVTRQGTRGYVEVSEDHLAPNEDGALLQRFFQGQVAEVLVYNRRLTGAEKEVVSDMLGEKYELAPAVTAARSDDARPAPRYSRVARP